MKERRMERLVLLPFSIGCVSESSVAVGVDQPRVIPTTKLHTKPHKSSETTKRKEEEDRESSSSIAESMKSTSSFKFLPLSKLLKSFKNFAQLFVYKEEIDEESEMEMEIGYPTDVKHVTHIGLDGSANTNAVQGWDHLLGPELLSIKNATDSLKQFELSMAAQADHAPLVKAAT